MNLVFLYGRPAVGKLTVARRLAELAGLRLFHNHLVVDTALSLYDFGTEGFVALRAALWDACLAQVLADRDSAGLVFTFNPERTVSQAAVDGWFRDWRHAGIAVHVVELVCDEATLEARMGAGSRQPTGKLTDVALYRRLRDDGAFDSPVIPGPALRVDTTAQSPEQSASEIFANLGS